jgi:hypothetical protein
LLLYFAATLFVSAFLLFLVQPMIGKMILPRLGGAPQVWNTCMVFFQAALLAGYAYTHTVSTKLPLRRQLIVHGCILFLPFLILLLGLAGIISPVLPFTVADWIPPPGANPIWSTLGILTVVVGIPFFVVATSAPLLQRWFAHTGHPAAKDPYFLYGASNFGSMLALLSYPFLVEPNLSLMGEPGDLLSQTKLWLFGYAVLVILVLGCASVVWKAPELALATATPEPEVRAQAVAQTAPAAVASTAVTTKPGGPGRGKGKGKHIKAGKPQPSKPAAVVPQPAAPAPTQNLAPITPLRRLRWVLLAAVPTSLMLGVTTFISTDITAIPLLWVATLSLYLLTFIIVFARNPILPHRIMLLVQPFVLGVLLWFILRLQQNIGTVWQSVLVHSLAFFVTTMVCHGELARDRPSARHLTEFYLWMSVGGVLGGMFNALIAPLLFYGVVEYPLAIVLAGLLRPQRKKDGWTDEFVETTWPGIVPWAREKGNALAARFGKPAPNSTYVLNYGLDVILALFILVLTGALISASDWFTDRLFELWKNLTGGTEASAAKFAQTGTSVIAHVVPIVICVFFANRPLRFGLSIGAILLAAHIWGSSEGAGRRNIVAERSYFGILRLDEVHTESYYDPELKKRVLDPTKFYHRLMHGTTEHGLQCQLPTDYETLPVPTQKYYAIRNRESLTYYHRRCPVGQVMDILTDKQVFTPEEQRDNEAVKDLASKGYVPPEEKEILGLKRFQPFLDADFRMPASLWGMCGTPLGGAVPALLVDTHSEPAYATIGLGTGTMASYAKPFQHITYYEIDRQVREFSLPSVNGQYHPLNYWELSSYDKKKQWIVDPALADDEDLSPYDQELKAAGKKRHFTYLYNALRRGARVEVIMGDARLSMQEEKKRDREGNYLYPLQDDKREHYYHVIVVDAFSSDAIPVHLLTKEAVQLYMSKLAPGGVLCLHTSNRHLNLVPVCADIADSLNLAWMRGHWTPNWYDTQTQEGFDKQRFLSNYYHRKGYYTSEWVMVAQKKGSDVKARIQNHPLYKRIKELEKKREADLTPQEKTILKRWERSRADDPEHLAKLKDTDLDMVMLYDAFSPSPTIWGRMEEDRYGRRTGREWGGLGRPWTDDYSNLLSVLRWGF